MAAANDDLDLLRYTSQPQLDVAGTVTLATQLLGRVPEHSTFSVHKAAKGLRVALEALRAGWHEDRCVPQPEVTRRKADQALDGAWGNFEQRLSAFSCLPESTYPDARKAREIHHKLFPNGMSFLTKPYREQWAESDKRLAMIEQGGHQGDLTTLVGEPFLLELRRTHNEYGKALGVPLPVDATATPPRLDEPLGEVRRAIKRYAIQVIAMADAEHPGSIARIEAALAPIAESRISRPKAKSEAHVCEPEPEPVS